MQQLKVLRCPPRYCCQVLFFAQRHRTRTIGSNMMVVVSSTTRWQAAKLARPYDLLLLQQVRGLHKAYSEKTIWVIDTTFATMRGTYPVPFILSIRDLRTSKAILHNYHRLQQSASQRFSGQRTSTAMPYFRTTKYMHK
jgi:hypothetical protein